MASFGLKSIEVGFDMAGTSVTCAGLAVEATITKPGLPDENKASLKVWGLRYELLDQLTTLGFKPMESQKNLVTVRASEGGGLAQVFRGEIVSAWADFNQSPTVPLVVEAKSGFYPQRVAAPPTSVNGEARVADLVAREAHEMGYDFRDGGVTASVKNAVFSGSPLAKAQAMAAQVGADLIVDDGQVILLPAGGHREGGVPLLTDRAGLFGYPTFTSDGISCRCHFRADIDFGGLFRVESIVPKASGTWKVTKLTHNLSAVKGDAEAWVTELEGQSAE